jgi:serine/threonine protein phosphatase 1
MFETRKVSRVQRFAANPVGRDLAVGDIHGYFTRLQVALEAAGFNPSVDRLFSVGDLVDRGPQSLDVDQWLLRKPWFHAVRGNHEQMTVDSHAAGRSSAEHDMHFINGGAWFYGLSGVEQAYYADILGDLPLVIEVETTRGLIGIVHADVPRGSWEDMTESLSGSAMEVKQIAMTLQWSRRRITDRHCGGVSGVRAVVVGHTPLPQPVILGNVYHIDTGGWLPERGHFTLLNLQTLEFFPAIGPSLSRH